MVFPIHIIGSPVLRQVAKDIDIKNFEGLEEFTENMFDTMYDSEGVGLASPQAGKSIRFFIIDGEPMAEDYPELKGFKKVFINAKITSRAGEPYIFNEGCLSIPGIREDVEREEEIEMEYYNENGKFFKEKFKSIKARIIQHEYDHIDGILFTDRLSPIRKRFLKRKLLAISKGDFDAKYKFKLGRK